MTTKSKVRIRIFHRETGVLLAEGFRGWQMTPFEGNFYIQKQCLRAKFRVNFIPGICPYKGLYFWVDLELPNRGPEKSVGWKYWLPNPLLPFIWYRLALPGNDPTLRIEESQ